MKIAILAAGDNRKYFPFLINKPKCMYHLNGQLQIQKVIEDAKAFVPEKDIIVIGGYKYKTVENYLKKHYPEVEFRNNARYLEPAIYSYRLAAENVDDDVLFMLADESISHKNIERIAASERKLSLLYHNKFYFYSVGIFKLRKDALEILKDEKYLDFEYIKEIYKFANNKTEYDGEFNINSGICLGYMLIDIVRRIGNIEKVENPSSYTGNDVDFLFYDPEKEYIPDLDTIYDTDEYKHNFILKCYNKFISNPIKNMLYHSGIWK